ncbi:putative leader peptide [Streptomyces sp. NPDC056730]|uniref:putative leader peptide n=1 Tax=unclassified Streptomyces TaxID=2593676 RepID=UPI0036C708FD
MRGRTHAVALTIVTVHISLGALRDAVKEAGRSVSPDGHSRTRAVGPAKEIPTAGRKGIAGLLSLLTFVWCALGGATSARPTRPRGPGGRRAGRAEVRYMRPVFRSRAVAPAPPRPLHLYSRTHIDLLRVAGALCRA